MKMVAARAGLSEPGIGDGPVAKFFRARFAEKSRSAEPVSAQPWIEIRPSGSPSHNRKLDRAALSCSSHTSQKNFATGPPVRRPDREEAARIRQTRVVLAAAHLDHNPSNNRLKNLK